MRLSGFILTENSIYAGVITGVIMSIFLASMGAIGIQEHYGVSVGKHLLFGVFIGFCLHDLKRYSSPLNFLPRGIAFGLFSAFFTSMTLILISFLNGEFVAGASATFFGETDGLFLNASALFIEMMIFGLTSTIVWLQFLKSESQLQK